MIHRSMSIDDMIKKLKDAKKRLGGNKDVFSESKPIREVQIVDEKVIILLAHS